MLTRLRRRLNYASVAATLALVVALSGGAYALKIPKHSVGTKQLKRGAVTSPKIKRDAITSPKIKNGAVTVAKLADGLFSTQRFVETGNGVGNNFGCGSALGVRVANGLDVAVDDRFTFQVPGASAQAWGQIRSGGSIRSSSPNVTSVDHPETGVYCIQILGSLDFEGAVVSMHLN